MIHLRTLLLEAALCCATALAAPAADDWWKPFKLPDGLAVVTDTPAEVLVCPDSLKTALAEGEFTIARTPPTMDYGVYDMQSFPGNPWSAWGDNIVVGNTWYSSVGDHAWNAYICAYDIPSKTMRTVLDIREFLDMPEGHYVPGKVHGRLDMGRDGKLYFATHRGAASYTDDPENKYHFEGDWILAYDPKSGTTEIVCHAPVGRESIPVSVLDPARMIFYGGTQQSHIFFAYDLANRKLLYKSQAKEGPYRYLMFSKTTGRVYYCNRDYGDLRRYDPETNEATVIDAKTGLRACTLETPQGYIYAVANRWQQRGTPDAKIYRFDVRKETVEKVGYAPIGRKYYITTIDADPTGRYLYYSPGAHGKAYQDGTPVIQFDVKTGKKKVIAFLADYYGRKYQLAPDGTFGSSLSPDGGTLFVTWMSQRKDIHHKFSNPTKLCSWMAIHIPESERTTN